MNIINKDNLTEEELVLRAVETLKKGGILIYPTETTYGLGVDCENPQAVEKLMSYKERREGKPLSVAVADREMAERYVDINATANNIYNNFLPGPVTVVSNSKNITANGVASEKGTLGIRIPNYPLILKIIATFGRGITATSANQSGEKRPYKIEDILENISSRQKDLIDLILDVGELPHNNPSTVIDTVSGEIKTIRLGDNRFDLNQFKITKEESQTTELGYLLGTKLKDIQRPTVIAIQGELGAGKTHFAGGVAKGLNIQNLVKSPTFILSNEFNIPNSDRKFFHIDTYRMDDEYELIHIGFEQMLKDNNIILIEWANRVIPILDKFKDEADYIWLKFEYLSDNERKISYTNNILDI